MLKLIKTLVLVLATSNAWATTSLCGVPLTFNAPEIKGALSALAVKEVDVCKGTSTLTDLDAAAINAVAYAHMLAAVHNGQALTLSQWQKVVRATRTAEGARKALVAGRASTEASKDALDELKGAMHHWIAMSSTQKGGRPLDFGVLLDVLPPSVKDAVKGYDGE